MDVLFVLRKLQLRGLRGFHVGGEFETFRDVQDTVGDLLIVSSFVTKRATIFKYSMNAESIGGGIFPARQPPYHRNFHRIYSIHSQDIFHSRRLPRTRGTLIPRPGSLLLPLQPEHLPKLRLIDRKLIVHLRVFVYYIPRIFFFGKTTSVLVRHIELD